MVDRRISKRLKGKVMSTYKCYTVPTERKRWQLKQQRLQVCENNWVRKNSKNNEGKQEKNGGVKRRDGSAEELDRAWQITVGRTRKAPVRNLQEWRSAEIMKKMKKKKKGWQMTDYRTVAD